MIASFVFYLFAVVTVFAGIMVITSRNPVHSVLFLILAFFNTGGLFILLGAEFLAMLMVVVYVGAVAVLFLFVVMMLDINFVELRQGVLQYAPIGAAIGLVLLVQLIAAYAGLSMDEDVTAQIAQPVPNVEEVTNTHAIGQILYTDYVYLFQAAGMVLLVGMIGAIILTHRKRTGVRKQNIAKQVAVRPEASAELRKVDPGKGA